MKLLYSMWLAIITLDAAANWLAMFFLLRFRDRFGIYIAMACAGSAAEATITRFTMGMWQAVQPVDYWIIYLRIFGRAIETIPALMLTLYLLGYVNGSWSPRIKDK